MYFKIICSVPRNAVINILYFYYYTNKTENEVWTINYLTLVLVFKISSRLYLKNTSKKKQSN